MMHSVLHNVCILWMMHQRETLEQQTQELEALVRSYMQRMGKCPISGRGVALEEELEALVQVKDNDKHQTRAHAVDRVHLVIRLDIPTPHPQPFWMFSHLCSDLLALCDRIKMIQQSTWAWGPPASGT